MRSGAHRAKSHLAALLKSAYGKESCLRPIAEVVPVPDLLRQHQAAIEALCKRFCVRRLELFGSAVSDRFEPAVSDLDFLAEFEADSPVGPFHQFFDFRQALEDQLGHPIDFVETTAIRNPYFRSAIERSLRTLLYAA